MSLWLKYYDLLVATTKKVRRRTVYQRVERWKFSSARSFLFIENMIRENTGSIGASYISGSAKRLDIYRSLDTANI